MSSQAGGNKLPTYVVGLFLSEMIRKMLSVAASRSAEHFLLVGWTVAAEEVVLHG